MKARVFSLLILGIFGPALAEKMSGYGEYKESLEAEIHDQAEHPDEVGKTLQTTFFYEIAPEQKNASFAVGTPVTDSETPKEMYQKVNDVFKKSFESIDSFKDSMSFLRDHRSDLDLKERMLLLSMIGSELAYGYDFTFPKDGVSLEALFQNAQHGGNKGGVCTDIANYMSEVQRALGFVDVGMHDLVVPYGSGTIGHAVSHFRDPLTGNFYVQNYSVILNTNRHTVTEAIDISDQVFGLMSGVTYIETKPGHVHQYIPYTSRWVARIVKGEIEGQEVNSIAYVKASPVEQSLVLQTGHGPGVKGFVIHSARNDAGGKFQVDAIGVAGSFDGKVKFSGSLPIEIGMKGKGRAGALYRETPNTYNNDELKQGVSRHVSPFVLANIETYAQMNPVRLSLTGELEGVGAGNGIDEGMIYINRVWHQFGAGADILFGPNSMFQLGIRRLMDLVPGNLVTNQLRLHTVADRVHAVWDSRRGNDRAYVVIGQEVYLFEGIEKLSAVGFRNYVRGAVPAGRLGEFYMLADLNGVIKNQSSDPFYEADRFIGLCQGWKKVLAKGVEMGADVKWGTQANPFFDFNRNPGGPTAAPRTGLYSGDVWLRFSL